MKIGEGSLVTRLLIKDKKDVELILRFFSFYEKGNEYVRPIKDFMSNYMRDNQEITEARSQDLEILFKETCDKVVAALGDKPFHIWSGLNVAAFDSIFTTLAIHGFSGDLAAKFENLKVYYNFVIGVRC